MIAITSLGDFGEYNKKNIFKGIKKVYVRQLSNIGLEGWAMMSLDSWKRHTQKLSREKKLKHFFSLCTEGMSVLDVGVSKEDSTSGPHRNYFLKHFPYPGHFYTGLGVQDLTGMDKLFPDKKFVQYPGKKFPFKDSEFDWVFSNAVIEHVGLENDQLLFLNEMLRVADQVYFTTPNKFFPIEAHTKIFFLHWSNYFFYRWLAKYRNGRTKETLYLLSYNRLKALLKESNASQFTIYKNRYMGLTMTFTVVCSSK